MNYLNLYIQLFGSIALLLWVISIQISKKSKILIFQLFANVFYAIQYTLLGAYSAVFMNITSIIRSFIYSKYEKNNKNIPIQFMIFFCFMIIIIGFLSCTNLISIIPIIITLAYCIASWIRGSFCTRIIFVLCAILWIFYNISVHAYISVIGNILEIFSGVIALIRFRKQGI